MRPAAWLAREAPELLDAVPAADRDRVRQALCVPAVRCDAGPLQLTDLEPGGSAVALMLLDGALVRSAHHHGQELAEHLAPGDVLAPWDLDGQTVRVLRPARLAVLDHRFLLCAARWPGLMRVVQQRQLEQGHRVAVHGAICQLPRVDDRIVGILRHLGARIGRPDEEGLVVPLALTHAELGALIGARRPTVSLALTALAAAGKVRRRPDGQWVLPDAAVVPL